MIEEDYVSLETAKLLKEKGFNEPCKLFYDKYHGYIPIFVVDSELNKYGNNGLVRNDQIDISAFICSAPSLYIAMKWLREVHNLCIEPYRTACGYLYTISNVPFGSTKYDNSQEYNGDDENSGQWSTWELACEDAIQYCLKNLIQYDKRRSNKDSKIVLS